MIAERKIDKSWNGTSDKCNTRLCLENVTGLYQFLVIIVVFSGF